MSNKRQDAPKNAFKIVGIIGGMGPEATVDLMHKIVAHTSAKGDADHVHCLVDSNPQIPSRVQSILEGGESPGPWMSEMARRLEKEGADFLCIACNTAHNWYPEVAEAVAVPVLHMPEIAVEAVVEKIGPVGKYIGILCTPGTHKAEIYENPCQKHGLRAIYADNFFEGELMDVINSIKAGDTGEDTRERFADVVEHMATRGANALILGCTELGVIGAKTALPVVDAAEALAIAIVREAGAKLR